MSFRLDGSATHLPRKAMGRGADTEIWQDREIRFDVTSRDYLPRLGEEEIDSINAVEDTKGNNGIRGSLSITNLRIRWVSHKNTKINLSIGLNMIAKMQIKHASSKLRGVVQALYLIASDDKTKTRYEFIFTSLVNASPRLFTTAQAVYRAYETSRAYRELKLRGALVFENKLRTLPGEEIYETIPGVWNLSADQGNLGTFFITTVRLVWFADLAPNFNVSIPYLQVKDAQLKPSKFGQALVVRASQKEGGYHLGFRMDPVEKLERAAETIANLHALFSKNPNFGVHVSHEAAPQSLEDVREKRVEEDASIVEDYGSFVPASFSAASGPGAYITQQEAGQEDGEASNELSIEYSAELGCAIQKLPPKTTAASLWALMSS